MTNVPIAFDVLTVGEPMALFMATEPAPLHEVRQFARVAAGAELNVAIGLSRLGLRTAYVTRVGADSFGQFLQAEFAKEGIASDFVTVAAEQRTGFMLKTRSADGSDPQIEYFRAGSAASHLSQADLPAVFPARHLHVTGITPALSPSTKPMLFALIERARAAGASISFDPNLRPRLWPSQAEMISTLNQIASLVDLVLPGISEGDILTGSNDAAQIAHFYLQAGAKQVVVKLGPQGAYYQDATGDSGLVPGVAVSRVVDTVGAGDGFATGVISALVEGLRLDQAAARGNAIGARVVQFPGDSDGLPTRTELGLAPL